MALLVLDIFVSFLKYLGFCHLLTNNKLYLYKGEYLWMRRNESLKEFCLIFTEIYIIL